MLVFFLSGAAALAQSAFLNEIHYDNAGADVGEGIEVAGPAGTALEGFEIIFYNGSGGRPYRTIALHGVIPDERDGSGAVWFPVEGIQNGDPDGVVLYDANAGAVVHLLAWDGTFTGSAGVAAGLIFPDMGVGETSQTPSGYSLQLTGDASDPSGFRWSGPRPASPGRINEGQTIRARAGPRTALAVVPGLIREGDTTTAMLSMTPPPPGPVTAGLSAEPHGLISMPREVAVGPGDGVAMFPVEALRDFRADGFQEVIIRAEFPGIPYGPAAAALQIIDADRPERTGGGFIRLVSLNVRLGVGAPGSAEFASLRELTERLSPDILLLQEVDEANGFADLRLLLQQAGFPPDAPHVAVESDAFAGQPYSGGDFNVAQSVVTASRWPIVRAVQIGRGEPDRREIARFPLYTAIRIPGGSADLGVVNVHFKAGDTEADRFRRAVEAYRVRRFLEDNPDVPALAAVVIAGDCNASDFVEQTESFSTALDPSVHRFSDGSGLPATYLPGPDLAEDGGLILPYAVFPHSAFSPLDLAAVPAVQGDGTVYTFAPAPFRLDYVFLPRRILDSGHVFAQVWNSRLTAVADGLPCRIENVDPRLSEAASDHYPVVVDFRLSPLPQPVLTVDQNSVEEGTTGVKARISVLPPPDRPVAVTVSAWREERVGVVPSPVVLSPARTTAELSIDVPHRPEPEPHRQVMLVAAGDGLAPAMQPIEVRNREAAGLFVISQYTQPQEGTSPRALELLNVSGDTADFRLLPLQVRRYADGSPEPEVVVTVESGLLPDGAVMVVGDAATGNYLAAQGLIPPPTVPFSLVPDGTVHRNSAGEVAFVRVTGTWDGGDALEVVCGGYRCDVFGTIGEDPGTGWADESGAVTTAAGNLSIRPERLTGSSGFRDPGLRFVRAEGSALTGFGSAPIVQDPYLSWAEAAGYSGPGRAPNADPDRTGTCNLLRWILGDGYPPQLAGREWRALTRLPDPGTLAVWEESPDLLNWVPAEGVETRIREDGYVEWIRRGGTPPARSAFQRIAVRRP